MNSFRSLLVVFAFVGSIAADCGPTYINITLPGSCPPITALSSVDLSLAAGASYRFLSSRDATTAGCDGDCITTYITRYDDTCSSIEECCKSGCYSKCGYGVGSGFVSINPDNPAEILYDIGGTVLPVYILDTDDFLTYAVLYSCISDGCSKTEIIEVLTRINTVSLTLEQVFWDVIAANGLDSSMVQKVSHYKACPYNYY